MTETILIFKFKQDVMRIMDHPVRNLSRHDDGFPALRDGS